MTSYSNHFDINKNFQSSINLGMDLNSPEKVDEYIPTSDICDVLKRYFKTFDGKSKDYATTLVGPYGKGKSFLLLVLSYISGVKKKDQTYNNLLLKIKDIDTELYHLIKDFTSSKKRLLTIIIDSNYNDLQQSFMLGLNEALVRENIENIVPNTVYKFCANLLDNWSSNSELKNKVEKECTKELKINIRELRSKLMNFSPKAYDDFKAIYNCVTGGLQFNPLINNDIVKTFKDVNHELGKHGYTGMLIIFDEFSKFIETSDDSLMRELKIIQDFAELANRSSENEQINLCCITHKSLDLYNKNSSKADAFKTVEGRFKEIKFNRSLEENYQIISSAIQKKEGSQRIIQNYKSKHLAFYNRILNCSLFQNKKTCNDIINGCFPLNPMTVYALIQLSEIVAQNERTLFTFLSDSDDYSFNVFLKNWNDGLFNVDRIYDYFSDLLEKEESNSIRSIWYRAEGALSKETDKTHRRLLKILAIILMINDTDRLMPNVENLSLCSEIDIDETQNAINDMIDKHYLRINALNNTLSFATTNNKAIEEQIAIIEKAKKNSFEINTVLEDLDDTKYVLPRRYNEKNKITRFYRVVYLTESQLNNITDFSLIKNQAFCDGLVINLIREKMKQKDIETTFDSIEGNEYSIIRYPLKRIDGYFKNLLLRYASIKELLARGGNDQVVVAEIELLLNETTDDIKLLMDSYFENECHFHASRHADETKYTNVLSEIMSDMFQYEICFNNELINKDKLTTQYQKAVNNVMEYLLKGSSEWRYSTTSPEGTIKTAVLNNMDDLHQPAVANVVQEIRSEIIRSGRNRLDISKITSEFTMPPYGIRRGILQILVAKAISELASDNVILYLDKNEIELNSENIGKSIFSNQKYYFGFAKGSKEQTEYLDKMLNLFNVKSSNNYSIDIKLLCDELRKFFIGLPEIVRSDRNASYLGIPPSINQYKMVFMSFNINSFEAIYVMPQEIFKTSDFKKIYKEVAWFVNNWNSYIEKYEVEIATKVKKTFGVDKKTSLKMGLNEYVKNIYGNSTPILNGVDNIILEAIKKLSYDNNQSISQLSYACVGAYLEDWNKDRSTEMLDELSNFQIRLNNANKIDISQTSIDEVFKKSSQTPIGKMGRLLQSTLQSTLAEYHDSVTNEEKIAILSDLIKHSM